MTSRYAAIAFRFFFAALALVAVGAQLSVHITKGYDVVSFFSYFTNLGNIFISVVFIVSAIRLIRNNLAPSQSDVVIRGAAVVYIAFVGLVFNTLLRDVDLGDLLPWVNLIVHLIVPIAGVLDWILWPPRRKLPLSIAFWWLSVPAVYTAYSLIRGALIGFYPYPFFNPALNGGYGGVALYCAAMLVGFLVLALLIRWIGNLLGRKYEKEAVPA